MKARGVMLRLLLLGASTFVALSSGESLARLLAARLLPAPNEDLQFDPALGWTQRPGTTSVEVNEDGESISISGSALGIREPTDGFLRTDRTNVLVLGDSLTAGTQVRFEQTWPALTEEKLVILGQRIRVVNAAVDGYDLAQEYWLAERLWSRFRPSLLVVALYVGNDIKDYERASEAQTPWQASGVRGWLRRHSYLYHVLSRARQNWLQRDRQPARDASSCGLPDGDWPPRSIVSRAQLGEAQRRSILCQLAAPELLPVLNRDETARRRLRTTTRVLESFARLAAAHSARLMVVLLPFKLQVIPAQRQEWMELHHLSADQVFLPQRELRRWASGCGVQVVDVGEAFARYPEPERLFWPVDLHFSPAGHVAVAEALARALAAGGDTLL
jgi:lysophospholipase L1-like esterase